MELPSSSFSNYKAWTFEENKQFEKCLAMDTLNSMDDFTRWQVIANFYLEGKRTPEEVRNHYNKLLYDVTIIESGTVCLPEYKDDDEDYDGHDISIPKNFKYTQWSKDEHRLFLIGELIYGEGDWRSIARLVVQTRSSTQVASHAQKFYNRQKNPKNTKRASIHDITTVDHDAALDLYQRGLISFEILKNYLGKLASIHIEPETDVLEQYQLVNKDDINSSQVSNKSSLPKKRKKKSNN